MTIKIKPRPNPALQFVLMIIAIPSCLLLCVIWAPAWMIAVACCVGYHIIQRR